MFWVLVVVSAIVVGAWIIAVNSPDDEHRASNQQ